MQQFSVTQWIFGSEALEVSCRRLKETGYSGIELAGEPETSDAAAAKNLLKEYGLSCTSICGIFTPSRNLSSMDKSLRANAVTYLKKCCDFAASLDAPYLIVVPSSVGKTVFESGETYESCWESAKESILSAADYARKRGVTLVVEAVNRYETCLVYNLTSALHFIGEIHHPSVQLMADLFHMNIEERDSCHSLELCAPHLRHVHLADNTREPAGMGNINFPALMKVLKNIGYSGSLTMEFLPPVSDPYTVSGRTGKPDIMTEYTRYAIDYIKKVLPQSN